MRRSLFLLLFVAILTFYSIQGYADQAPSKIANFQLGEKIGTYSDVCNMMTALPVRDMRYLTEVEAEDIDGYKSGSVAFGNCANPGQIVRIKMKYAYADKKFFRKLLELFQDRFGKPDEYRGDPFQAIVAWKWYFKDEQNNKITMTLQHSEDLEYKFGNTIKLTNSTLLEKERTCYDKKNQTESKNQKNKSVSKRRLKEKDYLKFIPE